MGLFQILLKLIKMTTHELITKPEIVQLHLTDTAVQLLVPCLTSERYEQTTLITKKPVRKLQGTNEDLCTLVKKLLWLLIKISLLSLPLSNHPAMVNSVVFNYAINPQALLF